MTGPPTNGGSITDKDKSLFLSCQKYSDQLWSSHPVDNSLHSNGEVKNEWSFTPLHLHAFLMCTWTALAALISCPKTHGPLLTFC